MTFTLTHRTLTFSHGSQKFSFCLADLANFIQEEKGPLVMMNTCTDLVTTFGKMSLSSANTAQVFRIVAIHENGT